MSVKFPIKPVRQFPITSITSQAVATLTNLARAVLLHVEHSTLYNLSSRQIPRSFNWISAMPPNSPDLSPIYCMQCMVSASLSHACVYRSLTDLIYCMSCMVSASLSHACIYHSLIDLGAHSLTDLGAQFDRLGCSVFPFPLYFPYLPSHPSSSRSPSPSFSLFLPLPRSLIRSLGSA